MLFISRELPGNSDVPYRFEIVDTEDGVATVADYADIKKAFGLKVPIYGVSPNRINGMVFSVSVTPYQDPKTFTSKQVKLKTLSGVALTTYQSMITSIQWLFKDIPDKVRFRLSDYGTGVAYHVIRVTTVPETGVSKEVVMVLDDKLSFEKGAFQFAGTGNPDYDDRIGIKFDIRELSDNNAKKFYTDTFHSVLQFDADVHASLRNDAEIRQLLRLAIIDDEERKSAILKSIPYEYKRYHPWR